MAGLGLAGLALTGLAGGERRIGHHLQHMDVEAQIFIGLERAAGGRRVAIGELAGDFDLVAAALLHPGQRLAKAGDDLRDQHRRGATAIGGVEYFAVFGALFGIMGLLLADPIVATVKTTLEDLAKKQGGGGKPAPRKAKK